MTEMCVQARCGWNFSVGTSGIFPLFFEKVRSSRMDGWERWMAMDGWEGEDDMKCLDHFFIVISVSVLYCTCFAVLIFFCLVTVLGMG